MRRLRVAIVIPGFVVDEADPGMAAVVDLVRRLAEDHEIAVIALRHPSERPQYAAAGARVRTLGLTHARGPLGRATVLVRGIGAVIEAHRTAALDIVHGLWADEAGAVAALAGRLVGRPSVVSLMGGELMALPDIGYGAALGRGGRWTTALALRLATVTTAASEAGRAALRARHHDVLAMPLGVDTTSFRPPSDAAGPANGRTVLFAGSLEPVKDPGLLLRAVALLVPGRPDLRVEFAGDGALRSALERLAADLGIEDRVRFAGFVPRVDLPAWYRSGTLLAVPSRHESQSMVALEAAASGLPVVGTAVGILPDLGEGAAIVTGRQPEALAQGLASVLDDPARAARMAAASRAAAARFALHGTADAVSALYERLVTNR
jgi:glycosyltransferase involved in cell wall biosynthesis